MKPTRRDGAAELARLLEDPAAGAPSDAGLERDLAVVAGLAATRPALEAASELPPAVRAAQRSRVLAVAHVQSATGTALEPVRATRTSGLLGRVRTAQAARRTVVVAGAMASVVAVSGVAVAASRSLPGDPFYDVKRTTEAVQLRMALGDTSEGELQLDLAQTRLREVRGLTQGRDASALTGDGLAGAGALPAASSSETGLVSRALEDMDEHTQLGSDLLMTVSRTQLDTAPLHTLQAFALTQSSSLLALLPGLPAGAQARAATSSALVAELQSESSQLLISGFCTSACDPVQAPPTAPRPGQGPGGTPCACPPPQPGTPTRRPGPPSPEATPTAPAPSTPGASPAPGAPTAPPPSTPEPSPAPTPPPPGPGLPLPSLPGVPQQPTAIPLPGLTLPGLTPLLGGGSGGR